MTHRTIVDVHVLLVRDGHVLLTRRAAGYGAGQWHMPSGKLEAGESIEQAALREAHEEVGVVIDPAAGLAAYRGGVPFAADGWGALLALGGVHDGGDHAGDASAEHQ